MEDGRNVKVTNENKFLYVDMWYFFFHIQYTNDDNGHDQTIDWLY